MAPWQQRQRSGQRRAGLAALGPTLPAVLWHAWLLAVASAITDWHGPTHAGTSADMVAPGGRSYDSGVGREGQLGSHLEEDADWELSEEMEGGSADVSLLDFAMHLQVHMGLRSWVAERPAGAAAVSGAIEPVTKAMALKASPESTVHSPPAGAVVVTSQSHSAAAEVARAAAAEAREPKTGTAGLQDPSGNRAVLWEPWATLAEHGESRAPVTPAPAPTAAGAPTGVQLLQRQGTARAVLWEPWAALAEQGSSRAWPLGSWLLICTGLVVAGIWACLAYLLLAGGCSAWTWDRKEASTPAIRQGPGSEASFFATSGGVTSKPSSPLTLPASRPLLPEHHMLTPPQSDWRSSGGSTQPLAGPPSAASLGSQRRGTQTGQVPPMALLPTPPMQSRPSELGRAGLLAGWAPAVEREGAPSSPRFSEAQWPDGAQPASDTGGRWEDSEGGSLPGTGSWLNPVGHTRGLPDRWATWFRGRDDRQSG